jgi:hypothetical protein
VSKEATIQYEFVDVIPEDIATRTLYISLKYNTAIHACMCGCGEEVVTPLSPHRGWILTYDGVSVSLFPSIGNWALPCRSHYWIDEGRVTWAPSWSDEEVREHRLLGGTIRPSHRKAWWRRFESLVELWKEP